MEREITAERRLKAKSEENSFEKSSNSFEEAFCDFVYFIWPCGRHRMLLDGTTSHAFRWDHIVSF